MPNTSASRSWAVWYDGNRTWISRARSQGATGHWNALGATHRYVLCRDGLQPCQDVQPSDGYVNFIMLNPSVSGRRNSGYNDRSVAKCEKLARYWGYRKLIVTNLFALIDPKPENLPTSQDPVGPRNDHYLVRVAKPASLCVAAWGEKYGAYHDRSVWFRHACNQNKLVLKIFGRTKFCQPKHPARLGIQQFQNISSLPPYPYPC